MINVYHRHMYLNAYGTFRGCRLGGGSASPQEGQALRIYTSSYFLIVLCFLSVDKNITYFLLLSACHVFGTIIDALES